MLFCSGQCGSQSLALLKCVIIRLIVGRDAVRDKIRAGVAAIIFPVAHPFSVAPSVRAEQSDLFAGEFTLHIVEHRLEFTLFQYFSAHRGAAESDGIAAPNSEAVLTSTSAPAPCAPAATASAIVCVLPVPLQNTTATLLIFCLSPFAFCVLYALRLNIHISCTYMPKDAHYMFLPLTAGSVTLRLPLRGGSAARLRISAGSRCACTCQISQKSFWQHPRRHKPASIRSACSPRRRSG